MRAPLLIVALSGLVACADEAPDPDSVEIGERYATDAVFRHEVLESSLVNPDNTYSSLRLARYDDWGALPVWAPDEFADVDEIPWEHDALVDLGRRAFFGYPMQLVSALELGVERPEAFGVEVGIVEVELDTGPATALTCAACHAASVDGVLVPGLNNADFDLHGMLLAARGLPRGPSWWGRGRVDVTGDDIDNPTAIPDLRPVRHQTHLHRAATVRNGLVDLAIRTETLVITSMGQNHRPPRKLAFALALYLWELSPPAPGAAPEPFVRACAPCHGSTGLAGEPVAIDVVGTPDDVARSPERTTGMWRVPSLVGVGVRRRLTASGQVDDLDHMLDPRRDVPGHRFGHDLSAADRDAILRYLSD